MLEVLFLVQWVIWSFWLPGYGKLGAFSERFRTYHAFESQKQQYASNFVLVCQSPMGKFLWPLSCDSEPTSALPSETLPTSLYMMIRVTFFEKCCSESQGASSKPGSSLGKIWIPCWGIIHSETLYRTQKLRKYQMCWLYFVLILCYIPEPVSFIKWQFC